jgi:SPP1 family predicted phage head-tail adaptor
MGALRSHINIGSLDRLISIYNPVDVAIAKGGGEMETSFVFKSKVAASKIERPGDEAERAMQETSMTPVYWVIRYQPGMTSKWRIKDDNDQLHQIEDIQEVGGRRRFLRIKASMIDGVRN